MRHDHFKTEPHLHEEKALDEAHDLPVPARTPVDREHRWLVVAEPLHSIALPAAAPNHRRNQPRKQLLKQDAPVACLWGPLELKPAGARPPPAAPATWRIWCSRNSRFFHAREHHYSVPVRRKCVPPLEIGSEFLIESYVIVVLGCTRQAQQVNYLLEESPPRLHDTAGMMQRPDQPLQLPVPTWPTRLPLGKEVSQSCEFVSREK